MSLAPWVAIMRNRRSGAGRGRGELLALVRRLREHGIQPRLFSRRERPPARLVDEHRRGKLLALVAAGGDGTVAECVNRFPGVPLAVLPLGTENLLARYLGVRRSGRAAADIIAAGHTRRLDLGTAGERRFTLLASVGFDADVVHRLDARRTGHISRLHYLPQIVRSLWSYQHPELRLYVDDNPQPLTGRMAVLMNLPMYGFGLRFADNARGDDGRLDLRLFERGSTLAILHYACLVRFGRHEGRRDVASATARRVRIESDVPVPIEIDGDPAGCTPVEFGILPAALEVFAPTDT
ncbi:MAG: diacylglycerol kinase family lipid kinase [Planctomycetes bacterium]|nr:diacylglycerol kinase family lipid kinase [Planctomycetota bacterium]